MLCEKEVCGSAKMRPPRLTIALSLWKFNLGVSHIFVQGLGNQILTKLGLFNGWKCLENHYNKVGLHPQITNKDM
jgi:hypothetical protein